MKLVGSEVFLKEGLTGGIETKGGGDGGFDAILRKSLRGDIRDYDKTAQMSGEAKSVIFAYFA